MNDSTSLELIINTIQISPNGACRGLANNTFIITTPELATHHVIGFWNGECDYILWLKLQNKDEI